MISEYYEAESFIRENLDREITLGLERITELLDRLGNPHKELKFIHVAGTNGKGTVCAMTAQILKEASLTVGLFTSPVIFDYREQFQVNGEQIPEEEFAEAAREIEKACGQMGTSPAEFEKCVAMAMLYFRKKNCDMVVLEVGMGGEGDATNVIPTPEIAVIVNIDYDHTAFLGETLEEIAEKKAGIIKPDGVVVLAKQSAEVHNVVEKACETQGADIVVTDYSKLLIKDFSLDYQVFDYKEYEDLKVSLLGEHQCENTPIVIEVIECLRAKGYRISDEALRNGIFNTRWPGRFQVISKNPAIILDGAHNPHGISALQNNLRTYLPGKKFVFIVGILRDKNYVEMLRKMLPFADSIITISPPNPRALPAEEMAEKLVEIGFDKQLEVAASIPEAVDLAVEISGYKKPICAFGSLYSIGALTEAFSTVEKNRN